MDRLIDLAGQRFGRWVVVELDVKKKRTHWVCRCDCGNVKSVIGGNLRRGKTISCGCHRKEYLKELKTIHGQRRTRLFGIWSKMKERCYKPNTKGYKDYGGRGITVCDEWRNDFVAFHRWAMANGYDETLTIERINNNAGYSPDNCKWATRFEQNSNKRNNHYITIDGLSKTVSEWARVSGISRKTIQSRIAYGWNDEDLIKPVKGGGSNEHLSKIG